MPSNPRKGQFRVSLFVYVQNPERTDKFYPYYRVLHIGFFSPRVAQEVAKNLDARGLASCSDFVNPVGMVDVVLAEVQHSGDPFITGPDTVAIRYEYATRRSLEEV
jgi:hypothetical protein